MASRYIANTPAEQDQMLRVIGAASVEELLVKIPPKARLSRPLALPPALAETDLIRHLKTLADANADADRYACFLGAGSYDHYVPSPINHLVLRGEFFTAYTPYQPEASQGTLRTIYEYQTMIAELTGMDVANASIYDGASSVAEAVLMAHAATERTEVVVSHGVNPLYRRATATYREGPRVPLRDAASCSRSRRASSTSAARRRPPISAPTSPSAPSWPRSISRRSGGTASSRSASSRRRRPTTPPGG